MPQIQASRCGTLSLKAFCPWLPSTKNWKKLPKRTTSMSALIYLIHFIPPSFTIMGTHGLTIAPMMFQLCAIKLACALRLCFRYLPETLFQLLLHLLAQGQHTKNTGSNQEEAESDHVRYSILFSTMIH